MLKVYLYLAGATGPVEIACPLAGQEAALLEQSMRQVRLWWNAGELEKEDPAGYAALSMLMPRADAVVLGRETEGVWRQVFEGQVVECGRDANVLSVQAVEVTPPRPVVPSGGEGGAGLSPEVRAARPVDFLGSRDQGGQQ